MGVSRVVGNAQTADGNGWDQGKKHPETTDVVQAIKEHWIALDVLTRLVSDRPGWRYHNQVVISPKALRLSPSHNPGHKVFSYKRYRILHHGFQ